MWGLHSSPLMKIGPTRSLLDAAGVWRKIFSPVLMVPLTRTMNHDGHLLDNLSITLLLLVDKSWLPII
jgi:hypothetical protein